MSYLCPSSYKLWGSGGDQGHSASKGHKDTVARGHLSLREKPQRTNSTKGTRARQHAPSMPGGGEERLRIEPSFYACLEMGVPYVLCGCNDRAGSAREP